MLLDNIEIKSIRKIAGEWHVVVTIPNNCGCRSNGFMQVGILGTVVESERFARLA